MSNNKNFLSPLQTILDTTTALDHHSTCSGFTTIRQNLSNFRLHSVSSISTKQKHSGKIHTWPPPPSPLMFSIRYANGNNRGIHALDPSTSEREKETSLHIKCINDQSKNELK